MRKILFFLACTIILILLVAKIILINQKANKALPKKTTNIDITYDKNLNDGHFMRSHHVKLSPIELASTPTSSLFQSPIASKNSAFSYLAQDYLEYNTQFSAYHLGYDLNGIGGDNTDLGDPVFAVGDGKVVFAGDLSIYKNDGWGKIIIILHRLENGSFVQSFYAHLDKIKVAVGQFTARGQKIGTIGTANGKYLAHLHFEIRSGYIIYIGNGYCKDCKNKTSNRKLSINSQSIDINLSLNSSSNSLNSQKNQNIIPPAPSYIDAKNISIPIFIKNNID